MDQDAFERLSALDFSSEETPMKASGAFGTYKIQNSGKLADIDLQLNCSLRAQYPELIVTVIPTANVDLLQFASAGFATAELDIDETVIRWRGWIPPLPRGGGGGYLADGIFFARYRYRWGQEDFLLYTVVIGPRGLQYVLKEPRGGEKTQDHSRVTDALIAAIGLWRSIEPDFLVEMWKEVQKASWDKVILDPKMKKELVAVCDTFFDSEDTYKEYGVPWKRGLIFHGPPGNGKTVSIKALMHSMEKRKSKVPCLYIKSARGTYAIGSVFTMARLVAPCLLIFEDIDTIVVPSTRAYFFNEVDGVANNDGIMMVASTNYLDRLDPGLTKRPSRFDRKYLFPLPNRDERVLYAQFWQKKMEDKPIEFPDELCPAIADITADFSFAYMQELFIASLLQLARGGSEGSDNPDKGGDDELDKYELWRALKQQAKILRDDMDSDDGTLSAGQQQAPPEPTEPQDSADIDFPRPVTTTGGTRLQSIPRARDEQVGQGRRLTAQEALEYFQNERSSSEEEWRWRASRNPGL